MGEGEENNFSCLLVLGLFCDVLCVSSFSFCFSMMSFYFSFLCLSFGRTFFVLILLRLLLGEETPSFLFFLACQSRNSGELQTKAPPSNLFFRLKMRFWARKSYVSKKKTPRKVWFSTQKRPNREKYRSFGANMIGRGWSEKTGFTAVFATL